jgi:hypothetical protein
LSQLAGLRGLCEGSFGGGAGGTVPGDISDSLSTLHEGVSSASCGAKSRCTSGSETLRDKAGHCARHMSRASFGDYARAPVEAHSARNLPTTASSSCSSRWNNVPRIEILVRFDGDGGAPQRARASIGPYRVAGARTPRALHRSMAADGLIPRHVRGRRGACSGRVATVARASAAAITAFGRRRRAGLMGTACAERAGTATSSRRDSSWRCATWAAVGRRAAIEAGEAKRGGR